MTWLLQCLGPARSVSVLKILRSSLEYIEVSVAGLTLANEIHQLQCVNEVVYMYNSYLVFGALYLYRLYFYLKELGMKTTGQWLPTFKLQLKDIKAFQRQSEK